MNLQININNETETKKSRQYDNKHIYNQNRAQRRLSRSMHYLRNQQPNPHKRNKYTNLQSKHEQQNSTKYEKK